MNIEKLISFFRLKGVNKEDNRLIQMEKINYLKYRVLKLLGKNTKKYMVNNLGDGLNLGEGLKKPIIVNSSNKLFYCREKSADLHVISDSYEFKVKKLFEEILKREREHCC